MTEQVDIREIIKVAVKVDNSTKQVKDFYSRVYSVRSDTISLTEAILKDKVQHKINVNLKKMRSTDKTALIIEITLMYSENPDLLKQVLALLKASDIQVPQKISDIAGIVKAIKGSSDEDIQRAQSILSM
jgi:ferritin-like protein